MGDSSDNIPRRAGRGEKTALKPLQQFSSLEEPYANLDKVQGKLRERLAQYKDQAFLSKELATIRCDVPADVDFAKVPQGDPEHHGEPFNRLEFNTFMSRLPVSARAERAEPFDPALEVLEADKPPAALSGGR